MDVDLPKFSSTNSCILRLIDAARRCNLQSFRMFEVSLIIRQPQTCRTRVDWNRSLRLPSFLINVYDFRNFFQSQELSKHWSKFSDDRFLLSRSCNSELNDWTTQRVCILTSEPQNLSSVLGIEVQTFDFTSLKICPWNFTLLIASQSKTSNYCLIFYACFLTHHAWTSFEISNADQSSSKLASMMRW